MTWSDSSVKGLHEFEMEHWYRWSDKSHTASRRDIQRPP